MINVNLQHYIIQILLMYGNYHQFLFPYPEKLYGFLLFFLLSIFLTVFVLLGCYALLIIVGALFFVVPLNIYDKSVDLMCPLFLYELKDSLLYHLMLLQT